MNMYIENKFSSVLGEGNLAVDLVLKLKSRTTLGLRLDFYALVYR